jgi:hypothetical protein
MRHGAGRDVSCLSDMEKTMETRSGCLTLSISGRCSPHGEWQGIRSRRSVQFVDENKEDLERTLAIAYSKVPSRKDDGRIETNRESDRDAEQPTDSVHPLE